MSATLDLSFGGISGVEEETRNIWISPLREMAFAASRAEESATAARERLWAHL